MEARQGRVPHPAEAGARSVAVATQWMWLACPLMEPRCSPSADQSFTTKSEPPEMTAAAAYACSSSGRSGKACMQVTPSLCPKNARFRVSRAARS